MNLIRGKIAAAFLLLFLTFAAAGADTAISILSGPITGEEANGVRIYRGIPYAAPPVGELRWKPPVALEPWTAPREMTRFGAVSPQPKTPFYGDLGAQSEDCLFLNVWTSAKNPAEKLPVMVWIHGGAFLIGSGSQATYEGSELAKSGVVLVTLNYRLGPFGFIAHPALSAESPHKASGNYGLMDQAFALQWVRDNIHAFGGDPGNVTIFGESAGGASVCALMASPLAMGLFHKVIVLSGSQIVTLRQRDRTQAGLESAEELGRQFIKRLGLTEGPGLLKDMRAASTADVLKAGRAAPAMAGDATADHVIVDGYFLSEPIRDVFAQKRQANVPFICGDVAGEGTIFAKKLGLDSAEKFKAFVNNRYGPNGPEIMNIYPVTDDASVLNATAEICGDVFFRGNRASAQKMCILQPKTFMYYFTRTTEKMKKSGLGCYHGAELPYFFGNVGNQDDYQDADRKLSREIVNYLTRFAATGDPNGNNALPWPLYSLSGQHLVLDETISVGQDLRKKALDALDRLDASTQH